jgi:hypothetical protein
MRPPNGTLHHTPEFGYFWETQCRKCGTTLKIRIADLTPEEATEAVAQIDRTPAECPGFHTELTGWKLLWSLDLMLEAHATAHSTPIPIAA